MTRARAAGASIFLSLLDVCTNHGDMLDCGAAVHPPVYVMQVEAYVQENDRREKATRSGSSRRSEAQGKPACASLRRGHESTQEAEQARVRSAVAWEQLQAAIRAEASTRAPACRLLQLAGQLARQIPRTLHRLVPALAHPAHLHSPLAADSASSRRLASRRHRPLALAVRRHCAHKVHPRADQARPSRTVQTQTESFDVRPFVCVDTPPR